MTIRYCICEQFVNHLLNLQEDAVIAFFNLTFDSSQFIKYLVTETGLECMNERVKQIKKGQISILETDRKVYSIQLRSPITGRRVMMIDCMHFAPASGGLDVVANAWIGDVKIKLESKKFPKAQPTQLEKEYALKDARLTKDLYLKMRDEQVIENGVFTIAGRTMKHFKEFCRKMYSIDMMEYFYKTDDKEEIEMIQEQFETEIRSGVRGGICMAFHKGIYEHCNHVDAVSMYPTQCVRYFHPIGPLLSEPPNAMHTKILYPCGYYKLKKGKVPNMQWTSIVNCGRYHYIGDYQPSEYVNDFYLDGTYPIWEEEYNIVKECYDVKEESIAKVWYIEMADNTILCNYVNQLFEGKKRNKGTKRLFYKYLMNSLYGKFLTRPDGTTIGYFEEDDGWHRTKLENEKNVYYLPLGSWIAMMGRVTLMKAILSIDSKNFLYCDTDSIIYKGDKMPDVKLGKDLGCWEMEREDVSVNIVGPKTYQELITDDEKSYWITKCGGLPNAVKSKVYWRGLYDGMSVKCEKPRRDTETWAISFRPTEFTVSTKALLYRRG